MTAVISRRNLLAAPALLAASPARAQQLVTLRLGHVMAPTHFENIEAGRLAEDVARRSNGRIKLEVFPASQLGSEREQTEQVNLGALEMHSSGGAVQNYAPALGLLSLPFLFRNAEHYDHVMAGPIPGEMRDALLKASNIRLLAFYPNGNRMFFDNKRPFTKLADFKGVRIRVDDQPISAQIWRLLGANPVPIAFAETYSALQAGIVDAAENPPASILQMRFYEVGKYVTATRHSLTPHFLMVNETWWRGLPDETRTVLTASIADFVPKRRAAAWKSDDEALEKLRQAGAVVSELENRAEFAAALAPLYKDFGERTKSSAMIQQIIDTP